jgi:hypothetical protein
MINAYGKIATCGKIPIASFDKTLVALTVVNPTDYVDAI